jgi:ADP-heptose:LPS heptosyltransferase
MQHDSAAELAQPFGEVKNWKEDQPVGDEIKQAIGDSIFNSCGQFNLNQSASLVKQAKIIISHDTGLMHIAAAFKKNILSLWGNTIPELGMYPYLSGEKSEIIEVKGLKCRPCTKIGFRKCPKKHFNCMNNIEECKITDWIEANFK